MPDIRLEPFRSLVLAGRSKEASDLPAEDAESLWARAQARIQSGRDDDARADLVRASAELGPRAAIELAYLDIRQRSGLLAARENAESIAREAPEGSGLAARAKHVLGLAEGKLRRTPTSLAALLAAADAYRESGDRQGLAEVHDTLGSLFAAAGKLEYAVNHYALSLVAKSRTGDRYGTALTLGNLGRLHLRAGRPRDALDCFQLDLELAREIGDERGVARMHEDLGRAHLALEDAERASQELERALVIARARGYRDLEFFALKDLALARMALDRHDDAEQAILEAGRALGEGGEPYLRSLLDAVRGEWMYVNGKDGALDVLLKAAREFGVADLPDFEIPLLIALAGAYCEEGLRENAEACLRKASKSARGDGYARYLPKIREAMAQLSVTESAIEERGRLSAFDGDDVAGGAARVLREAGGPSAGAAARGGAQAEGAPIRGAGSDGARSDSARSDDGYVKLATLGKGAFGEVFRAYDPVRGHEVALKRLTLEGVYDADRRRRILISARLELESVSRLRHPGIARVFSFGTDPGGATYIVQELVDGDPLRKSIPRGPTANPAEVAATIAKIAHALVVLHASGIVHRDLKPENVLMRRPSGDPVLIDFGIAHVPDPKHRLEEGYVVGTLEYMAPEQASGKTVDGSADVYALGVLAYEWLTGIRPIRLRIGTVTALADELRTTPPVPIEDWRRGLPIQLVELIELMLAKKPGKRPMAAEVAEECAAIVKALRAGGERIKA